jgi:hypothetical protein
MNSRRYIQKAKPPEPPVKTDIDASRLANPPEISPDDIPIRLKEDIRRWKMEADKHREYFREKGINPFQEAHEILLSFLTTFDKVAGMKAK